MTSEVPRFHHHVNGKEIPGLPPPAPCPFCGKTEYGGIVTCEAEGPTDISTYHVQCDSCGAEGPPCESLARAAEVWNGASAGGRILSPTNDHVAAIDKHRKEMFGANAVIGIVAESMSWDSDHDRKRALQDAYDRFDKVAGRLEELSIAISKTEVLHA